MNQVTYAIKNYNIYDFKNIIITVFSCLAFLPQAPGFSDAPVWHWAQSMFCYLLGWAKYILESTQINFTYSRTSLLLIRDRQSDWYKHQYFTYAFKKKRVFACRFTSLNAIKSFRNNYYAFMQQQNPLSPTFSVNVSQWQSLGYSRHSLRSANIVGII